MCYHQFHLLLKKKHEFDYQDDFLTLTTSLIFALQALPSATLPPDCSGPELGAAWLASQPLTQSWNLGGMRGQVPPVGCTSPRNKSLSPGSLKSSSVHMWCRCWEPTFWDICLLPSILLWKFTWFLQCFKTMVLCFQPVSGWDCSCLRAFHTLKESCLLSFFHHKLTKLNHMTQGLSLYGVSNRQQVQG